MTRERTAYHEAGHACIARLEDVRVYYSTIEETDGTYGVTRTEDVEYDAAGEPLENSAKKHMRILYGGAAAEKLVYGNYWEEGLNQDFDSAFELFLRLSSGPDDLNATTYLNEAVSMLKQNRDLLDAVARALLKNGKLEGEEIHSLARQYI